MNNKSLKLLTIGMNRTFSHYNSTRSPKFVAGWNTDHIIRIRHQKGSLINKSYISIWYNNITNIDYKTYNSESNEYNEFLKFIKSQEIPTDINKE